MSTPARMFSALSGGAVLWCGAVLAAQGEEETPKPPATFEQLRARLAATDGAARRASLLRRFLEGRSAADLDGLRARVLLADHHLQRLDLKAAQGGYRAVVERAPAVERDLRARALYGVCQTAELLGQQEQCTAALDRLLREFRDLRYGRFAEATAARLRQKHVVRIGAPAPGFEPLLDLTGRPRAPRLRAGKPTLLLFVAPSEPAHLQRAEKLLAAWRAGGGADDAVIVLAIEPRLELVTETVKNRGWKVPVVHCGGEFLTPALLQFGVQALPASFLVGPDGTLLLNGPRPALLRKAAETLAGG